MRLGSFFNEEIYSLKYPIMQKKSFIDDEEIKMIFRQIGFGAILGTAFLTAIYLGELIAIICSGMWCMKTMHYSVTTGDISRVLSLSC